MEETDARLLALGVRHLHLDGIATTLRISKKNIYQHFPNKTGLLQRVFQRYEQHADTQHQLFRQAPTALAELRLLLRWFREEHLALPPGFMPELARAAPVLYESWQHYEDTHLVPCLAQNLQRGQVEGAYRPLDTPVLSRWYLAQLRLLRHDRLAPEIPLSRQHRVLAELFLRGILRQGWADNLPVD